ncbi:Hypothetical predicted protein [Marmota monax]|uniref:G-protein coupled receptors family 1 profile domain-containing protein n=1 Tax=Marmota monax TaxID=9995 RepID=A0A5E4CXL0_MARMO|nr:Hypothetical predicted protein [Marmota monax]
MEELVEGELRNRTTVHEFILEGFPAVQHLGGIFFMMHLLAYLTSIMGNMLIITIIWADHRLQTPMYFFLSNFSFIECCFITTVIPKLLTIFLSGRQTISFAACFTQDFIFLFLGATVFFLLSVLSLDRYLAICKPLHYLTIMNPTMCNLLVASCLALGFFFMVVPVAMLSQLTFCGPNVIPHFFCDFGLLTNLSCSNTRSIEILFFNLAFFVLGSSLVITIIAYSNIVLTIMRLPSAKERQRAFSTCSSHLLVLSLTYSSCVFIYVKQNQESTLDSNREAALVNTVVTPLLNPVIYTLRNKQVHQALRDTLSREHLGVIPYIQESSNVTMMFTEKEMFKGQRRLMTDRKLEITMGFRNETTMSEFTLLGFPAVQHLGKVLFLVHLLAYLASITGNMFVITITWTDHRLQTPMYFFLSSFSFCEFCFITTVIPKLLSIFLLGQQTINFTSCLTQAFSFLFLGSTIFFLMTVMSLDRYLAICKPLHYPAIMTLKVCFLLVFFCYILSFIFITGVILKVSQLSFCGSNIIPHFFCDLGSLIHLSCSETRSIEMLAFGIALFILFTSLIITIIAYSNIVVTIMSLPSAKERQRAFSTCSSHLLVLSLMYGSCVFIYVKPKQASRLDSNREAALVNTVVTPLLNPVIYTLRNKQVHQALRDALSRVKLQK